MKKKPTIIVILGQTATGKSNLAVQIAKKVRGEVISADSRQVYTGLDIGTGKITKKEMKGVPHYLLDVAKPKKRFTVAQFKKLAEEKIEDILTRGKTPIICGGTGFYIDAITKGVFFPEVPPNVKLRKILEHKTEAELFKMLQKLDQRRAKDIDKKNEQQNKVRLVRAIEIAKALGKVPKIQELKPKYTFIKIGLTLPTEELQKKVTKRVGQMFKQGLLKEITKLKKPVHLGGMGVSDKRLKEFGFEYYKPTPERVIIETIKYSKRQITWFKRDKQIKWFSSLESKKIQEFLKEKI